MDEAAPALGAVLMTVLMAHRSPMERTGSTMLWSVAGFGVATIVFGVSKSFPLSLAMLFIAGCARHNQRRDSSYAGANVDA